MTGALTRMGPSALCGVAFMGVGAPAVACSLVNPAEYMFSAVTLAARFWLASLLLGGLILCLDLYEKRLSLALPMAGLISQGSGRTTATAPQAVKGLVPHRRPCSSISYTE